MKPIAIAAAVSAAALTVPVAALAKTTNGITPIAPKTGATIPQGKAPTFRFSVKGAGKVWVHVCKSKKADKDGVICSKASIGRGVKKGSSYTYKPKFYDFPGFWLVTPGTYYWQAFRINCGEGKDCYQEGPITKVVVG